MVRSPSISLLAYLQGILCGWQSSLCMLMHRACHHKSSRLKYTGLISDQQVIQPSSSPLTTQLNLVRRTLCKMAMQELIHHQEQGSKRPHKSIVKSQTLTSLIIDLQRSSQSYGTATVVSVICLARNALRMPPSISLTGKLFLMNVAACRTHDIASLQVITCYR